MYRLHKRDPLNYNLRDKYKSASKIVQNGIETTTTNVLDKCKIKQNQHWAVVNEVISKQNAKIKEISINEVKTSGDDNKLRLELTSLTVILKIAQIIYCKIVGPNQVAIDRSYCGTLSVSSEEISIRLNFKN